MGKINDAQRAEMAEGMGNWARADAADAAAGYVADIVSRSSAEARPVSGRGGSLWST